jgi:2-amino-4-hydroxy-6-hydroxymethyldihydropteridine diphosphokinase
MLVSFSMKHVFIGLGANLDKPRERVQAVIARFKNSSAIPGCEWLASSSLYRTAPIDSSGPDYINAVIELRCDLAPSAILDALQALENEAGRTRPFFNAPRVLDLDLLHVEGITMNTPRLTLPHPRMHERAFVLAPLAELAPELEIGAHGSVQHLLHALPDQGIERIS